MRAYLVTASLALPVVGVVAACTGDDPTLSATPPDSGVPDAGADVEVECTEATDKSSDPQNCGACGHACGGGFACVEGRCDDDVVDVYAGSRVGCALLRGGKVYCWGGTDFGLLGADAPEGERNCSAVDKCRLEARAVPAIDKAVRVALGGSHACAVISDGSVKCWGRNNHGQLGPASALPAQGMPVPVPLPAGTKARDIGAGGDTTCVVTEAGEVYCWGDNEDGQVGKAPSESESIPNRVIAGGAISVAVTSLPGAADFADGHACALVGLQVQCWGGNSGAQLGRGATGAADPIPAVVATENGGPPFSRAAELVAGNATTCVRRDLGDVYCWGDNRFAVVPPPGATPIGYPTKVNGLSEEIVQLAAGPSSRLAVTKSGDVFAWGWSQYGLLATGSEDGGAGGATGGDCFGVSCSAAVSMSTELTGVVRVSVGAFGLALTQDGRVFAWGHNDFGTLGHLPGESGDVRTESAGSAMIGLRTSEISSLP